MGINTIRELEPPVAITSEGEANPEAPASPEAIGLVHQALSVLIDNAPDNFVWESRPSMGAGDPSQRINNIRLMSLPCRVDANGRGFGESFIWINYFDDESGQRQIMVTEDQGSGNPWGDVITTDFSIVKHIQRYDTAFVSPTEATVREGNFTFGPQQLEREENAAQVHNPFRSATNAQMDRLGQIMATGSIHSHDGKGELPPLNQLEVMPIADILLENI
ncbi:hypothetical protein KDA00_03465 [Candidatus Saccharibacteria bacterium]|nr:hypothetical protein [Candidatus Saccharibacteria bacterium]